MTRHGAAFILSDAAYWGDITTAPMYGGRELAAVRVAEELAARDWAVFIYAAVPEHVERNGVNYYPLDLATDTRESKLHIVAVGGYDILGKMSPWQRRIAWMQTGVERYGKLLKSIDLHVVNSPHKRNLLLEANPRIDPASIVVLPNGVDLEPYDTCNATTVDGRFLYNQSPDRGLHHLLRFWPTLKRAFPHITLHVTYRTANMAGYRWTHDQQGEWARIVDQGQYLDGVTYTGAVSREQLIREQKEAQVWVYPCDPNNTGETFNVSAMEMAAARVPMLLSDDVQLAEVYNAVAWFLPLPIQDDQWLAGITMLLTEPKKRNTYVAAARALAEQYTWRSIAGLWEKALLGESE